MTVSRGTIADDTGELPLALNYSVNGSAIGDRPLAPWLQDAVSAWLTWSSDATRIRLNLEGGLPSPDVV